MDFLKLHLKTTFRPPAEVLYPMCVGPVTTLSTQVVLFLNVSHMHSLFSMFCLKVIISALFESCQITLLRQTKQFCNDI